MGLQLTMFLFANDVPDHDTWLQYLIIRDVMDADWLAAANNALDAMSDETSQRPAYSAGSDKAVGTGRLSLPDLFNLPPPLNEPFLRMIAHPALVRRLNWIMGGGFRMRERAQALIFPEGTAGQRLHGDKAQDGTALAPMNSYRTYDYTDGKLYSSVVNVEWLLNDCGPEDGGVSVLPKLSPVF